MRILFCIIAFTMGYFKPMFSQSQLVKFDTTFLVSTLQGFGLSQEDRVKLMFEHKTIAIMPAVVTRYKGMFKPYPIDSNERRLTALRIQQMALYTLQTTSKKHIPRIDVKPILETNYILDSLYDAFPASNIYDIIKALGVDAILIPEYSIKVPRAGSYAAAGGLMIATALLGGGNNYHNLPETSSTLNYHVVDANMNLLWSVSQFENRMIVDPKDEYQIKQNISGSELRKLPYVELIYKIKNDKKRKIVNTVCYVSLVLGLTVLMAVGYSRQ
ncbi:MAG: hypothetical protein RLZZ252_1038 [Bacteroidota bacterium]